MEQTKLKLGQGTKNQDDKQLDQEALQRMLMEGEDTKGMFTPNKEEQEKAEAEEPIGSAEFGKVKERFGKYSKQMFEDMKKNPHNYLIETPRGVMPVTEAIRKGYNPATKEFDEAMDTEKQAGKIFEEEGVSPEEAQRIKQMLGMMGGEQAPPQDPNMMQDPNAVQDPNAQVAQPVPEAMLGGMK